MKHYQRLTREQRYPVESMSRQQCSHESITRTIGVHSSSVGRELRRAGMNRETYCHPTAQKEANSTSTCGIVANPIANADWAENGADGSRIR